MGLVGARRPIVEGSVLKTSLNEVHGHNVKQEAHVLCTSFRISSSPFTKVMDLKNGTFSCPSAFIPWYPVSGIICF